MPDLSLSRLSVAAVLCGAGLFGWSIGGVASVDQVALPQAQTHHERPVLDRERHGRDEL
jgi:hypothetical protein